MEENLYLTADEAKELPFIPLPKELENLPPLPEEQARVLRTLAKHAVLLIREQIQNGELKFSEERSNLEDNE